MTVAATAQRRRVPLAVYGSIGLAWAVCIAAQATGRTELVHHDALAGSSATPALGALVNGLAWLVMIAAMMLPSSLPMVRLFAATAAGQDRPGRAVAAFVGGYAAVWSGFGFIALTGDVAIHSTVEAVPWLHEREWVVGSAVLALAGAFQFTDLKDRCLDQCRHPAAFLLRHYRREPGAALRFGLRHGLFCLGCCWALMLLMFAAGIADLRWMAALAAVMTYEKVGRYGRQAAPVIGVALLGLAGLAAVQITPAAT